MSDLRKLYLPNELGDLCFLLHISSHHNVENNRETFKENLTTTTITKESSLYHLLLLREKYQFGVVPRATVGTFRTEGTVG